MTICYLYAELTFLVVFCFKL